MAYWSPPMASTEKDVWVFRIVHQDTGKPAQGVPVTVPPRPAEPHDVPAHVLYFQRLVMFAERAAKPTAPARDPVADFFALGGDTTAPLRYGALVEVEEAWQSLGVQWGELLYSVS